MMVLPYLLANGTRSVFSNLEKFDFERAQTIEAYDL